MVLVHTIFDTHILWKNEESYVKMGMDFLGGGEGLTFPPVQKNASRDCMAWSGVA
jgi:hypothetical protein